MIALSALLRSPERQRFSLSAFRIAHSLVVAALLTTASQSLHAQSPPVEILSVCDLFADLKTFDRKVVTVRGELFDSPYGFSMASADCGEQRFEAGNEIWPTIIDLFPVSGELYEEQAVIFAIRDAWKTGRPHAVATVRGTLHVVTDDKVKRRRGFGAFRSFPAQIRYESVGDVEFEVLPPPHELPVVSVCEVLSNLQLYRSKRVAVRGQFQGGYHGGFVFDRCPEPVILGGVRAETTISLGRPDYYPSPELQADFGIHRRMAGLNTKPSIAEQQRGRNSVKVWGTFIGVLRAREEYVTWCGEGRARHLGFGHLNAAPAELLIEASQDFQVEADDGDFHEPELDKCVPAPPVDGKTCEERGDLIEALAVGCSVRAEQLLRAGADPNQTFEDGWTVLYAAIQQGSLEIVRLLLDAGANLENPTDETPLCVAAEHDRPEIARLLIDRGAPIEPSDENTCFPLLEAAWYGSNEVVSLLLSAGADPNTRSKSGSTPLGAAADGNRIESMRLLIEAGADVNTVTKDGEPLLPAHGYYNRSVTQELIRAGASVDATMRDGQTALMRACESGWSPVAKLLLEAGADPNRKDNNRYTPLMHTVGGGYVDCIPLLAAHGADPTATTLQGKTARDLVTGNNASYLFDALDQVGRAAK